MDPLLYLGIAVIVLLAVTFVVSYVLNHRTPVPEGCENIKISEEFCLQCGNPDCNIKEKFDLEKIRKELEEDMEEK